MNAPAVKNDLPSLLDKFKPQIAAALPKHLTPDRMARIALTEFRKNPGLQKCDLISFLGAIIQCAQLGLEPGNTLGHVYLIPFFNKKRNCSEVTVIAGYRGMIDLARRSGQIKTIFAHVVKENDKFTYSLGMDETLKHVPAQNNRGKTVYVYAVAHLKDGGSQFEVMDMDQIAGIRERSRNPNPVWDTDLDEMCRKTAVRRLFKYLPVSIEMQKTAELEDDAEQLKSQNHQAIIDTTFVPDYNPTEDIRTMLDDDEKEAKANLASQAKAEFEKVFAKLPPDKPVPAVLVATGILDKEKTDKWSVDNWNVATEILMDLLKK